MDAQKPSGNDMNNDTVIHVFHCPAAPEAAFMLDARPDEVKRLSRGGYYAGEVKDLALPIHVQFKGGRFATDDAALADIILANIAAFPQQYGVIQTDHAEAYELRKNIQAMRAQHVAAEMGDLIGSEHNGALLQHAEQALNTGNLAKATALATAAGSMMPAPASPVEGLDLESQHVDQDKIEVTGADEALTAAVKPSLLQSMQQV